MKPHAVAAVLVPKPATKKPSALLKAKPKLLRDDYCGGLGDCLPSCPTQAISFIEREAQAYDEKNVLKNQQKLFSCPRASPQILLSSAYTTTVGNIASVTIVRMEVLCCGGLELAAKKALQASGKFIPLSVTTISTDSRILD